MRSKLLPFILLSLALQSSATTLTIKSPTHIKDTYVANAIELNSNAGPGNVVTAGVGTNGGIKQISRFFVRFDLTQIPAGSTINSATLKMYTDVNNGGGNVTTGGSNALYINRVTQDWVDNVVTFATEPAMTNTDQASVPATTSASQNLSADVSLLVSDIVNNPGQNYGFGFALQSEDTTMLYRSVHFFSIESADSTMWPELDIDYTAPSPTSSSGTVTIQQGSYIKDTYVADGPEITTNHGNGTVLTAGVGTNSGGAQISRSYVRFDLSQIPAGATINSATVTLFTDINNGGGNVTTGGSNAGYFNMITSDWDDNLITWADNLPYSSSYQGSYPATTTAGQNITADVTGMVQYFMNNPALNYGMALTLQSEDTTMLYRSVHTYSVEADSSNTWPQLVVSYSVNTGVQNVAPAVNLQLYPNPTSGAFTIQSDANEVLSVNVINLLGENLKTFTMKGSQQTFNISDLATDIYEVQISDEKQVLQVMKVVKE